MSGTATQAAQGKETECEMEWRGLGTFIQFKEQLKGRVKIARSEATTCFHKVATSIGPIQFSQSKSR